MTPASSPKLLAAALALAACTGYQARPGGPAATPAPGPAAPLPDITPRFNEQARVRVMPVLFFAADAQLDDIVGAQALLARHLELAREHYRSLLGSTFELEGAGVAIYRSTFPSSHFTDVVPDTDDDRAHRMAAELLRWRGQDRYEADVVFVALFVGQGPNIGGGGRTFNGTPGSGGGYVEIDVRSLLRDEGSPFQSTLVHELGHAFGLTHVDCHGYDLHQNGSVMSYNQAHWSQGLTRSATPGGLMPEDYFELALNRRVFPEFVYDAQRHGTVDSHKVQACFLGPMAQTIGPYRDLPGVGYELYYDGQRVNGPDAALYSRRQAEASCAIAAQQNAAACRYNGEWFRQ